jgi:hypothetical protein
MKNFIRSALLWWAMPSKPSDDSNESLGPFGGIEAGFITDPVSIVQAAHTIHSDFQEQRSQRRAVQQSQQEHINKLLAEHNVDLANYLPDFISRLDPDSPGGPLKGQSKVADVILALSDGTFVPNPDLGEK